MALFNKRKVIIPEKREQVLNDVDIRDPNFATLFNIDENVIKTQGTAALKIAVVFICINVIAKQISKLPLQLFEKDDEGAPKLVKKHSLNRILKLRPNINMSASDFKKALEVQRQTDGNCYAEIIWDKKTGQIKALSPIDSERVKVILMKNNKIKYEINIAEDKETPKYKVLKQEYVLHVKGFTLDGLIGQSNLYFLENLTASSESANRFLNTFYKNGVQASGILYYEGAELSRKNEKLLRERFERMASGLTNQNRTAILPPGLKYEKIASTLKDAEFTQNNAVSVKQIAAAFGVKNHQLNDLDRSTHTNITEQNREFYIDTLQEILTAYEQELTHKLLTQEEQEKGMYIKFNANAILRMNMKDRFESYKTAIQNGFLTPNEVRQLEEREKIDGADELIVNGNMMKVSQAGIAYQDKQKGGVGNEEN